MPKESITMTSEEIRSTLIEENWAVIGTIDPNGAPWGDIVPIVLDGDRLYFKVGLNNLTRSNLEQDPRVVCGIDQFPTYYQIKGISVHGYAEPVNDPNILARLEPLFTTDGLNFMQEIDQTATYSISLEDVSSFDFAKIVNKF